MLNPTIDKKILDSEVRLSGVGKAVTAVVGLTVIGGALGALAAYPGFSGGYEYVQKAVPYIGVGAGLGLVAGMMAVRSLYSKR